MDVLELVFNYENTGFCRTHYTGTYKGKKYNIVIIHEKNFENICTTTPDGEPIADLREGILINLNNKTYKTIKQNGYTTIKEATQCKQ